MNSITIDNTVYDEKDLKYLNAGAEGAVYEINDKFCLKRINSKLLLKRNRINKILALCDKFDYLNKLEGFDDIAIPIHPAYKMDDSGESKFCGFSMYYFKDSIDFSNISYDNYEKQFNPRSLGDTELVEIIKNIFHKLQLIHKAKIILGDVNPNNILFSEKSHKTYFIDIDSSKVNEFDCGLYSDDYCCPSVLSLGKNSSGGYAYSQHSDIYSTAIIVFDALIGIHPFDLALEPTIDITESMEKRMSFIAIHHFGLKQYLPYKIVDLKGLEIINKRLDEIKVNYPILYQFFLDTFYFNKREYYGNKSIKTKHVHSKKVKRDIKTIRGYSTSTNRSDPHDLSLFLNTYNII